MSVLLFINYKIPDYDIFINSVKVSIGNFNLKTFNDNITRIGFVWENIDGGGIIPFGSILYTFANLLDIKNKNVISKYFTQEIIDYLKLYKNNITVDLITCSLKSDQLLKELDELKKIFPNITFNYSINKTGNIPHGDWLMESSNEDIKTIYFNDKIDNYTHTLLNTGEILPNNNGIFFDSINKLSFSTITWTSWDDISEYGTPIQLFPTNINYTYDDELSNLINLQFNVKISGQIFNTVKINTNGILWFGNNGDTAYTTTPTTLSAYPAIQFFGLDTVLLSDGVKYVSTNEFIVFESHYTDYSTSMTEYKILLFIYKSGNIKIKYQIIKSGNYDILVGLCFEKTKFYSFSNNNFYFNKVEEINDILLNNLEINMINSPLFNFFIPNKTYGDTPFIITPPQLLIGTLGSRTFVYTSSDPTIASIIGNQITINKVGTVIITSTLPDDINPLLNPGGMISSTFTILESQIVYKFRPVLINIKKSMIKLKKLSNNGSNSIVVIKDPKNIIDIEYSIVCKEYYV